MSIRTFDRRLAGQGELGEEDEESIARWCGLPPAFFTMDFEEAARLIGRQPSDELLRRVDWLEEQMRLLRAGQVLGLAAAEAQRTAASATATGRPRPERQP